MSFFQSLNVLGAVGVAEIGDRTQLLAFLLAVRLRKPIPILCGILVGCFLNHAVSVSLGELLSALLTSGLLHWLLAASFAAMAVWVLFPDRLDQTGAPDLSQMRNIQIFSVTAISYFFAEIGDKTEVAAVVFGAEFTSFLSVVLSSTLGATLADLPIVLWGCWAGYRFAPSWPRYAAAAVFCIESVVAVAK